MDRGTLSAVLEALEPGKDLSLPLDQFVEAFGSHGLLDDDGIRAAWAFAEERGCVLRYSRWDRGDPVFHKPG